MGAMTAHGLHCVEFFFPKSNRERLESFQPGACDQNCIFRRSHEHLGRMGCSIGIGTLSP